MVFPVIVYGCESWTIRKAECWRIDAFELWCWRRLFRVPWTLRRSNQSILKYQPWIFIRRTDADAEAPVLWPPDAKSWFTGKDPDARKDWEQEEKGATEDKMVGWHHWLKGHEFEQTQGASEGQGSLACCSSLSPRELDTSWQLNNNNDQAIPFQVHTQETQKHLHLFFFFSTWPITSLLHSLSSAVIFQI